MQCEETLEIEVSTPSLIELDTALHDLDILTNYTNSRREYLKELQKKDVISLVNTINTRYVSNMSFGFRVRPVCSGRGGPHVRYKPYVTKREERHRTKSENNDLNETTALVKTVLEDTLNEALDDLTQLKKAKSLESIVQTVEEQSPVEVVSSCIERLKVNE